MASTLQNHTITAFYESRDAADSAATKLRASGVPASDVTVSPENAGNDDGLYGADAAPAAKKAGFWASLEDLFGGTDDHHVYAEGVRRGHVLLTAHVTDAQLDRSIGIIEEHGSIDLDEHEEAWRGEGWTGAQAASSSAAATTATAGGALGMALAGRTAPTRVVETETIVTPPPAREAPMTPAPRAAVAPVAKIPPMPVAAAGRGTEDVVQVVEERLSVGKRAVSRGKVRLHSYVVEREVSEDVTLRDETVSIDRHAVDRPVAALGADAFRERTIEMEEVDEEAVVAKTARVVEEIGLRKDVADRTETIRDTVRSTKVDIEDGRVATGAAGGVKEGSDDGRIVEHMEVYASDGTKVGTVDRREGPNGIRLAKGTSPDGQPHDVPMSWVDHVDRHVHLNRTVAEMKSGR